MRRGLFAVVAICFVFFTSLYPSNPVAEGEARAVWIETEQGFGSGVIVRSGQVLTNWHVVEGVSRIRVEGKTARLLRKDDSADLALLASPTPNLPPIRLQTWTSVGEDVFYVGNPAGIRNHVGRGRILDYPESRIHSSAFAWAGFSGSGLYNRAGELIGVQTEWTVRLGSQPNGLAISADTVKKFLDQ